MRVGLITKDKIDFISEKNKNAFKSKFLRLFLAIIFLISFSSALPDAHAVNLYEQEDHFKQSPTFYLNIFPKKTADQEPYYFNRALEYFTMKEYELSVEKILQLLEKYPQSKYKEYAIYLKADNEFYLALKKKEKNLQAVIHSYQSAIDAYPDSEYAPWAYFQVANCYNRMEYTYEAEAKYAEYKEKYPNGVHVEHVTIYKAAINYNDKKYSEAVSTLKGFNNRFKESDYESLANFLLADSYLKLGKKKEAYKIFDNVKGIEKIDPAKTLYYAKILAEQKRYKDAIYNLTSVINYFPKFPEIKEVYFLLAGNFLTLKDYDNAVYNYFYIIKKYPKSVEAIKSRLKIADLGALIDEKKYNLVMKSTDVDFVLDLKKVYIDVYKANKKNEHGEKALYELGRLALEKKNEIRAMKIYKKAYDEFPDGKYADKSFKHFIKYFNKLVKQHYTDNESKKVVALYHKYKKEIKAYSSKNVTEVLFYIGRSLMDLKLYSLAVEVFDRIRYEDKRYENEEVIYLCMTAAYASRDYEKAIECADELLLKYKKSEYKNKAEYIRAKSTYLVGGYQKSIPLLAAYLDKKINKNNRLLIAEVYSDIADAYIMIGKEKNAIPYYKKILKAVRPEIKDEKYKKINNDIILKLAGLSYVLKNYSDAIKYYEIYLKDRTLTAEDNVHLFYLALSYKNTDDYDSALLYFKELLSNSSRGFYARSAKDEIKYIRFLETYEDYIL
jgi:TolA-binding protein